MAQGLGRKRWAQKAAKKMKQKGTEGSLTSAAHKAGYNSAMEYAHHIKADDSASTKMKRKAAFALNMNPGK